MRVLVFIVLYLTVEASSVQRDVDQSSSLLGDKELVFRRIGKTLDSAIDTFGEDRYVHVDVKKVKHDYPMDNNKNLIHREPLLPKEVRVNPALAPEMEEAPALAATEMMTFERSDFNPYIGSQSPEDLIQAQIQNMEAINAAEEPDYEYTYQQQKPWDPSMETDVASSDKEAARKMDKLQAKMSYKANQASLLNAKAALESQKDALKMHQLALSQLDAVQQDQIKNRQDLKPRPKIPHDVAPGPHRPVAMLPKINLAANKILEQQERNMQKYQWTAEPVTEPIGSSMMKTTSEVYKMDDSAHITEESRKIAKEYTSLNQTMDSEVSAIQRQLDQRQAMLEQQKAMQEAAYFAATQPKPVNSALVAQDPSQPAPFSKPLITMQQAAPVAPQEPVPMYAMDEASLAEAAVQVEEASKTNACGNMMWKDGTTYQGEEIVEFQGHLYQCEWWTQNTNPAEHPDVWASVGTCACNNVKKWSLTGNYIQSDLVTYRGAIYTANSDNFGRDPLGFPGVWSHQSNCIVPNTNPMAA